jgi:hypothetical protein
VPDNYALKENKGAMRQTSIHLDFGIRWKWVISFTIQQIYIRGGTLRYSLDGRLCSAKADFHVVAKRRIPALNGNRTL